jgi:hypothetical protein
LFLAGGGQVHRRPAGHDHILASCAANLRIWILWQQGYKMRPAKRRRPGGRRKVSD